jgi:hypothetical protein
VTAQVPGAAALAAMWEAALLLHPIDRALAIASVFTGEDRSHLAALSIGRRDTILLEARRTLCGDRIDALCTCEACGEPNEFGLDAAALPCAAAGDEFVTAEADGRTVRARLPNSFDLAALAGRDDLDGAANDLLARLTPGDVVLSAAERSALEAAMEAREGLAGLQISFACSRCETANRVPFDIAAYVWHEIAAHVRSLLHDTHLLASVYGWTQAEVFALSPRRRALYVELVCA